MGGHLCTVAQGSRVAVDGEKDEPQVDASGEKKRAGGKMSLNVPSTSNSLFAKPTVGRSEYGRVKVALPRGKGLLDWINLAANNTLAKRKLPKVTAEELSNHNSREDCWVVVFGQVYDVTSYLDFHPGGIPELMRAAGTDATALFNQYHAWVNYESMLKACFVGRFEGDASKLPPPGPSTLDGEEGTSTAGAGEELLALSHSTPDSHNIKITAPSPRVLQLSCPSWDSSSLRVECLSLSIHDVSIRLLIRPFHGRHPLELIWTPLPDSFTTSTQIRINVVNNCIQLEFSLHSGLSVALDMATTACRVKEKPVPHWHQSKVLRVFRWDDNHNDEIGPQIVPPRNCIVLLAELADGTTVNVPTGHHVEIRVKKGGSLVSRPYTPIPLSLAVKAASHGEDERSPGSLLCFLIKIYEDGVVTPAIGKLKQGDLLDISDPLGSDDFSPSIEDRQEMIPMVEGHRSVLCLAAGTGITPMVGVLAERPSRGRLLAFNRTEDDRPRGEWLPFTPETVEVEDVLSEAGESWSGPRGKISSSHLSSLSKDSLVFVCGPDGFVQAAAEVLRVAGHSTDLVHVFQG